MSRDRLSQVVKHVDSQAGDQGSRLILPLIITWRLLYCLIRRDNIRQAAGRNVIHNINQCYTYTALRLGTITYCTDSI